MDCQWRLGRARARRSLLRWLAFMNYVTSIVEELRAPGDPYEVTGNGSLDYTTMSLRSEGQRH